MLYVSPIHNVLTELMASVKNPKKRGLAKAAIIFVNQNNPNQSPGKVSAVKEPPPIIKQLFKHPDVSKALGYTHTNVNWVWSAQDDSYVHSINKKLPVYFRVEGGPEKSKTCNKRSTIKSPCLALVDVTGAKSPKYALITKPDATPLFQLGNLPAIGKYVFILFFQPWLTRLSINTTVYFSNRKASSGRSTEAAHELATRMVVAFFRNKEIQKRLEFSDMPDIVYMDVFPSHGEGSVVHFEFLAHGQLCSLHKRCYAYIKFNHGAKPEPEYEGALFGYDYLRSSVGTAKPLVKFQEQITGA